MNLTFILVLGSVLALALPNAAVAQQAAEAATPPSRIQPVVVVDALESSTEQGSTALVESFRDDVAREGRDRVFEDTHFKFNFRTMVLERERYDGGEVASFATGGWVGATTGYLHQRISFGVTGYTSQRIEGDGDEDGAAMLEPVQAGYSVLGEAYADILVAKGLNLYAGRKEFDTPFINRNDVRMTPNTFELAVLQGLAKVGGDGATLKYGVAWFDAIKERNSEEFVSMAVDAGAPVERGVLAAGALYTREAFSIGGIDYHCADVINIFYAESKLELPIRLPFADNAVPLLAAQIVDQRSTGEELLTGGEFAAQQFGFKAELPVGDALFTTAYTIAGGDDDLRSPWSGYPGYTAVQVEDFNRAGEGALILRAAYDFPCLDGFSAYALYVNGGDPDDAAAFRKEEMDLNLQWAPTETFLKGLSLRLRYAAAEEHGPTKRDLNDFRVIANYLIEF